MFSKKFLYGKDTLTYVSALKISNDELKSEIGNEEIKKINTSRENIKNVLKSNQMIYGINTGFGALCNTIISNKDSNLLQENLLKSHAVGVGPNVPTEVSKLMLIIKVHSLCMGFSGIRLAVIQRICWHIENDIIPIVPSQGSVGASVIH